MKFDPDVVSLFDPTLEEVEEAMDKFKTKVETKSSGYIILFAFIGHGLQIDGKISVVFRTTCHYPIQTHLEKIAKDSLNPLAAFYNCNRPLGTL